MPASFVPPPGQANSLDGLADAANYNVWLFERARRFIGGRVLDFGAGIGTFTEAIAAHADVVAVEPDPQFAQLLRTRFAAVDRVTVVEADATWLENEDSRRQFDTVVCFNVLEHIRDDEAILRGFRECLSPGGYLLLLVPAHQVLYGEIDRNVGHERRYTRGQLSRLLRSIELEPLEERYVNPVGAIGWLVASRWLKHDQVPEGPLRAYDRLVPLLQQLDRLNLPFGLSLWMVSRRPE